MLTEMLGKGGRVCEPARKGELRCPLIVRPTSEDLITGQLFGALRAVNPRWWLPDLLNCALGTNRFRRQVFRHLKIEFWKNLPSYPRELLPYDEGSTQVDVVISWENPPTTVFIEMKYLASLSPKTAGDDGTCGFPSDQVIRNIRVGLWTCGWFERDALISLAPRDFVLLVVSPRGGEHLVHLYRNLARLRQSIPHSDRLRGLPVEPFLGQLDYTSIGRLLQQNRHWLSRPERTIVDDVTDYLDYKSRNLPPRAKRQKQATLPIK